MGRYFREILREPASITWIIVTGFVGVASFFLSPDEIDSLNRFLIVTTIALLSLLIGVLLQGYRFYSRTTDPVRIRSVVEGVHHNRGKLILILDKSPWVKFEQTLTLLDSSEEVRTAICLLRVETFTSSGFPQCTVLRALTAEDLPVYLKDRSRWESLRAVPEVLAQHVEG